MYCDLLTYTAPTRSPSDHHRMTRIHSALVLSSRQWSEAPSGDIHSFLFFLSHITILQNMNVLVPTQLSKKTLSDSEKGNYPTQ